MTYEEIQKDLGALIEGEIVADEKALSTYSTDASIFEVVPALIISPKNTSDIEKIVSYVSSKKKEFPQLSITARSAGTCMSGGSLNTSIILDMTKHMNAISNVSDNGTITVEPGAYYRDFEKKTLEKRLMLPSYTASKNLCTVGGMVANNSSGEMTLTYGDTSKFVKSLEVVLNDGKTYTLAGLNKLELEKKLKLQNSEGELYRKVIELVSEHYELIKKAKPKVSKNSSGYLLWNLWDNNTFNLAQLICGSQGTLCIVTKITFNLVPVRTSNALVVLELRDLTPLPMIINTVLSYKPQCFESYDEYTFALAEKYMSESAKKVITDKATVITLIAQFAADTDVEALQEAERAAKAVRDHGIETHVIQRPEDQAHYWNIRRASFQLLRTHSDGHERTAPFIDDIIVSPEALPKFLPRLQTILAEYKMTYTLAGHIGNGNFHLIPLVNMEAPGAQDTIIDLARRVFTLVFEYGGSMAGEHNDGIIRTPFVKDMFGKEVYEMFEKTKKVFDPENIFNPGKKVGGTFEYAKKHMVLHNINTHL